jgi:replicative DNA helicase
MKILLRSLFKALPDEDEKLLLKNFRMFEHTGLGFDQPEDNRIYEFLRDFVNRDNHVPSFESLKDEFTNRHPDMEVVDRLQILLQATPILRGDFIQRLETKNKDRKNRVMQEIFQTAATITQTGLEVGKGRDKKTLEGPEDAVRYILGESHKIVTPTLGAKLSGEITHDGDDFFKRYLETKNSTRITHNTGIGQIDEALHGARAKELWTHAAFTGHLKSMFMLNWAYNQAVYYGRDILIYSLEMPYEQVRNILYALHSFHEKFVNIRMHLGLQLDAKRSEGLEYREIRDGELSDAAEEFLRDTVKTDFGNDKNGYGRILIEVPDPEKLDFTVTDLRTRSELLFSEVPFSLLFVDHAGLMSSRGRYSSTTDKLNEVIRDMKKLAMGFNKGMGMATVLLFQINREGMKKIEKRQEKKKDKDVDSPLSTYAYSLTDLAYANECERSSDIVTASFADHAMKQRAEVLFQNLKSRDDAPFNPTLAKIYWPSRRIMTLLQAEDVGGTPEEVDESIFEE